MELAARSYKLAYDAVLSTACGASSADSACNCSFHPGSRWSPVINRAPRLNMRYVQNHDAITDRRLRNPMRKKICTTAQLTQAGNPLRCALNGHSTLAMATLRP